MRTDKLLSFIINSKVFLILVFCLTGKISSAQQDNCDYIYGKESSVIVFSGVVKNIKTRQVQGLKYRVKFRVDSVYKGDNLRKVFVYTSVNSNCNTEYHACEFCGFEFEKGNRYIVYVCSESSGVYETNQCTDTRQVSGIKGISP